MRRNSLVNLRSLFAGIASALVIAAQSASAAGDVVEAESRIDDSGSCGGGTMAVAVDTGASGAAVLRYPGSGCWALMETVVHGYAYHVYVRSVFYQSGCVTWDVEIDGGSIGSVSDCHDGGTGVDRERLFVRNIAYCATEVASIEVSSSGTSGDDAYLDGVELELYAVC